MFNSNRSVIIEGCNVDEDFALTQCNTSVLTSNCTTDDLAWVQCTLGSEFIITLFMNGSILHES